METIKQELEQYLPEVERFLTSVLLEETKVGIVGASEKTNEETLDGLEKTDIVLYSKDLHHNTDFVVVLDQEWYGLLSSIMLGVEEKSNNEVTRDLLKKFSSEMSATMQRHLEDNEVEVNPEDFQVLTKVQLKKELNHSSYFIYKMEVEGLADDMVRAEVLVGNPEAIEDVKEEEEPKADAETELKSSQSGINGQKSPKDDEKSDFEEGIDDRPGKEERVITGRQVEFDEFDGESLFNGENGNGHSMDLLKDVEMDVSVELGKIELPLGKVLQLSKGSVIELEKLAGEPVDILVNGHRIAHGEVVVIDEHFGVRISNLITTRQRLASLK
jgi:flagellar motor switch protein FliN/FliY